MRHTTSTSREIEAGERSGVLEPANLSRFAARWTSPDALVRVVADTYWSVVWDLPLGEQIVQRIVDFPAITVSIEEGDVPASLIATTIRPQAWSRVIRGRGSVFAIRLSPAGLAVLSDLDPLSLDHEHPITEHVDERLFAFLQEIAAMPMDGRANRADELIVGAISQNPPGRTQLLANAAIDVFTRSPQVRLGREVAEELDISERTLQRVLRSTVGIGPNDVARRIRAQEVVRRLTAADEPVATIAADLGYADQAHLINEFRAVSGTTPGRYLRTLKNASGAQ